MEFNMGFEIDTVWIERFEEEDKDQSNRKWFNHQQSL